MAFVDLHTHTYFSDGTLSADALLAEAKKAGLAALAITDHDTVQALERISVRAAQESDIEVVPGIELSAEHERREVHILGYYIDTRSPRLQEQLAVLKKNRIERVYTIIEKLKELGVSLSPESVFSVSKDAVTVGRMHVARALVREKISPDINAAFQKYIGDYAPAFVLGFKISPQEAIQLIRDSGGIAVLAHPYLLRDDEFIFTLIKCGLQGIEVYYPEHSQSQINFYRHLAEEHGLVVTGGSDYHGLAKPAVQLNCMKVPYACLERLQEAHARR